MFGSKSLSNSRSFRKKLGVSKNRGGPPKSSILIGCHPFWGVSPFFFVIYQLAKGMRPNDTPLWRLEMTSFYVLLLALHASKSEAMMRRSSAGWELLEALLGAGNVRCFLFSWRSQKENNNNNNNNNHPRHKVRSHFVQRPSVRQNNLSSTASPQRESIDERKRDSILSMKSSKCAPIDPSIHLPVG